MPCISLSGCGLSSIRPRCCPTCCPIPCAARSLRGCSVCGRTSWRLDGCLMPCSASAEYSTAPRTTRATLLRRLLKSSGGIAYPQALDPGSYARIRSDSLALGGSCSFAGWCPSSATARGTLRADATRYPSPFTPCSPAPSLSPSAGRASGRWVGHTLSPCGDQPNRDSRTVNHASEDCKSCGVAPSPLGFTLRREGSARPASSPTATALAGYRS